MTVVCVVNSDRRRLPQYRSVYYPLMICSRTRTCISAPVGSFLFLLPHVAVKRLKRNYVALYIPQPVQPGRIPVGLVYKENVGNYACRAYCAELLPIFISGNDLTVSTLILFEIYYVVFVDGAGVYSVFWSVLYSVLMEFLFCYSGRWDGCGCVGVRMVMKKIFWEARWVLPGSIPFLPCICLSLAQVLF